MSGIYLGLGITLLCLLHIVTFAVLIRSILSVNEYVRSICMEVGLLRMHLSSDRFQGEDGSSDQTADLQFSGSTLPEAPTTEGHGVSLKYAICSTEEVR